MRTENADRVFILVDVKHEVSIVILVSLEWLLFFYFGVSPAVFHVSIGDYFDVGDPVLKEMISHLQVAYKVISICLNRVEFAVIFDEGLRKSDFTLFGWVACWDVINSLNSCDSTVCVVNMECFYAVVGLFTQYLPIIKAIIFNASYILLSQLFNTFS